LLEGAIGLLAEAVFHRVMEVLMKLLTGKFGVWWRRKDRFDLAFHVPSTGPLPLIARFSSPVSDPCWEVQ
jgi:hypothetical protein